MDLNEGMRNASWEKQKEKVGNPDRSPDFHLDADKMVDPVETLIEKVGWDEAFDQINGKLNEHPDDPEARRQATLIVKLYDDRVKPLREKLQH